MRDSLVAVALIAVALGLWRQPITWQCLNAFNCGIPCAGFRFFVLFGGVFGTFLFGKNPSDRFNGLAYTLLTSWVITVIFPSLQMPMIPDFPGLFSFASVIMAGILFFAGWLADRIVFIPKAPRR